MPFCAICNVEIDGSNLYLCKYCGENYCGDHRLPPKHDCSGIEAWKGKVPPEGIRWSNNKEAQSIEIFFCKYCAEPFQRDQLFLCKFCLDSFCFEHKEPKAHACKDYFDEAPIAGDIRSKSICDYCEKSVEATQLFKCNHCGSNHCPEHHLPPNHCCIGITSWKDKAPPGDVYWKKRKETPLLKAREEFDLKVRKTPLTKQLLPIIFVIVVLGIFYMMGIGFPNLGWKESTDLDTKRPVTAISTPIPTPTSVFTPQVTQTPTPFIKIFPITYDKQKFQDWLAKDATDKRLYTSNYVCSDFTRDLINNASKEGFTMYYVVIGNTAVSEGHAVAAIPLKDDGWILVEPQNDIMMPIDKVSEFVKFMPYVELKSGFNYVRVGTLNDVKEGGGLLNNAIIEGLTDDQGKTNLIEVYLLKGKH